MESPRSKEPSDQSRSTVTIEDSPGAIAEISLEEEVLEVETAVEVTEVVSSPSPLGNDEAKVL